MLQKATQFSRAGQPYVDVPFRHGTEQGSTRLQGMPRDVHNAMQSAVRGAQAAGLDRARLNQVTPGRAFTRNLRLGGQKVPTQVQHKRGIYDDMIRTAVSGGGGQYRTIRRISANSAPTSWWHPGFKGVKLFNKLKASFKPLARQTIISELQAEGFKVT